MLEKVKVAEKNKMGPFGGLPPPMPNMPTPSVRAAEPALPDPGLGSRAHPREPVAKVEKVMGGRPWFFEFLKINRG